MPKKYISNQVIENILQLGLSFCERFGGNSSASYNLIGGEPTLNLNEFERVWHYVMWRKRSDSINLEMTTNGWWFRSPKTFSRFIGIVGRDVINEDISIRISDSYYHDRFRTKREMEIIKELLAQKESYCLEEEHFFGYKKFCPFCSFEFECLPDTEVFDCPGCNAQLGADDISPGDAKFYNSLNTFNNMKTLYVDSVIKEFQDDKVSPVGRALDNGIGYQDGRCGAVSPLYLTFSPDGSIYDVCCNGGKALIGTVDDGLSLIYIRAAFMRKLFKKYPVSEKSPFDHNPLNGDRCRECPSIASKWISQNLKEVREYAKEYMGITRNRKLEAA